MNLETEKITYTSPSIKKMLGYTTEECLSLSAKDVVTTESYTIQRQKLLEALINTKQEPEFMELEAMHKDGHIIPVEIHVSIVFDKQGNPVEILGVSRDITKRKKAEKKYRTLVNTMQEGLVGVDANWNINFVNDRFVEIIGYPKEQLIGNSFYKLISKDTVSVAEKQHELRIDGKNSLYELELITSDKKKLSVLCSPNPSYDINCNYLGGFGLISDITERKIIEKEKEESQK
ncbi:PAS domain-containing protein [Desulfobacula sp.]|uniref:PAS domain-containing protein n=1 Tax=Desulfobacula sp. TaxID=2593537 RepID=UPI0039B98217